MPAQAEPLVIVVSSPSGSGKTTIVSKLLEKTSGIKRSVSYTTRKPRDSEQEGKDYIFIPEKEFRDRLEKGDFIEWEKIFGQYYGTSKRQIQQALEQGAAIILSIDVRGARKVRQVFPEAISVFIMPPSFEELERRLENRNTESEEVVKIRLSEAKREIASSDEYDYMIINDDLEEAVKELRTIIKEERNNKKNKKGEENGTS